MAIKVLDVNIVNKIAAGEVVQNPASVVKELLDNAIDAGATKVTVEIENGGIDLIKVGDNGCGIEKSELKTAFLPHATSKIDSADDLDEIKTLGFRGEALASIAAVSKVTAVSKCKNSDTGSQITIEAGKVIETTDIAAINGTTVTVRNLFYNTPARFKFLKKPYQEEAEITNLINRYILSNPDISLKLTVNNKLIINSNGTGLQNAISSVYGNDITQNILPFDDEFGALKISGFVSKIGYFKPNTLYQTLIINGRYVIDPLVSKAVFTAFEDYLMIRQFPFYVINLTMDFCDVDVNTHPSKINVKFAHPNMIFDFILKSIRKVIYNFINKPGALNADNPNHMNIKNMNPRINENNPIKEELNLPKESEVDLVADSDSFKKAFSNIQSLNSSEKILNEYIEAKNTQNLTLFDENKSGEIQSQTYTKIDNFYNFKVIGTIFEEFLLLQKDDKFLLIDVHAAHERLLYDDFVKKYENNKLTVQDLLVPYIRTLSPLELDFVMQFKDELAQLGFSIEQFGKNDIKVSCVPVLFKAVNIEEFINDIVSDIKTYKPKFHRDIKSYLALKACKSAVKAGQTLKDAEINALLKQIDLNKPTLLCPHGRPIIVVVARNQIEKWFKRIV